MTIVTVAPVAQCLPSFSSPTRGSQPPLSPGLATLWTWGGRRPSTSSSRTSTVTSSASMAPIKASEMVHVNLYRNSWLDCPAKNTTYKGPNESKIYIHLLLSPGSISAWSSLTVLNASITISLKLFTSFKDSLAPFLWGQKHYQLNEIKTETTMAS